MTELFALQLVLPLVLVACVAFAPLRCLMGFWIQVAASAVGLLALALIGLWTVLPWWLPHAFGALLLIATAFALRRQPIFSTVFPAGAAGWAVCAIFIVFGGVALYQAVIALTGRTLPSAPPVELAFPLDGGTYLIANGGSVISINDHIRTLDARVPRFRTWRGQSHGVDIVKVDTFGLRASGVQPSEPSAYRIYGATVRAPCAGEIAAARGDLPDMNVPHVDRSHMLGNYVLLRCRQADILLAHFRPGSLKVAAGDNVSIGDPIASVGNTGNSYEPHLHIHAQEQGSASEPIGANPLPILFDGRYLVRNNRVTRP